MKSIKHRRPSMLDKWIMEQQQSPTEYHDALHRPGPCFSTSDASSSASFSNPYLAYPDLPRVPPIDTTADKDTADKDTVSSINSYDFINDDDIPANSTVVRDDAVPQVNIIYLSRSAFLIKYFLGSSYPFSCAPYKDFQAILLACLSTY
jgi:hypothetical protein